MLYQNPAFCGGCVGVRSKMLVQLEKSGSVLWERAEQDDPHLFDMVGSFAKIDDCAS